jgi:hypothetical protein
MHNARQSDRANALLSVAQRKKAFFYGISFIFKKIFGPFLLDKILNQKYLITQ